MQRFWTFSRILLTGAPAPGATVTVYVAGTLTLATIFADQDATPRANPFTADVDGYTFFYAANGNYDVEFSGVPAGIPTPYTLGDVLLNDVGTANPVGVSQAILGGSQSVSAVVTGSPATVDAVDYWEVAIPDWSQMPTGTTITWSVWCMPAPGSSVVAKLYNPNTLAVTVTDPTPFTDDTQFVRHDIVLTEGANPGLGNLARLRATVTTGDGLPLFFYGELKFGL